MNARSKVELERSLEDSRRRSADGVSKGRTADVAVDRAGAVELGVVKDVERFHPEEQGF
jgi:hypothetical protein